MCYSSSLFTIRWTLTVIKVFSVFSPFISITLMRPKLQDAWHPGTQYIVCSTEIEENEGKSERNKNAWRKLMVLCNISLTCRDYLLPLYASIQLILAATDNYGWKQWKYHWAWESKPNDKTQRAKRLDVHAASQTDQTIRKSNHLW